MADIESMTPRLGDAPAIPRVDLSAEESAGVRDISEKLLQADDDRPLEHRLDTAAVLAHELPAGIRAALTGFRLTGRPYGGLVLSGLPVDEHRLGPTPVNGTRRPESAELECATAALLLIGSLLGAPYSFLTQRGGELVRDVAPIPGEEQEKLASSSSTTLHWHTEDAFHPYRPDWLVLICLRNPDRVGTTFVPVTELNLTPETVRTLSEKRFVIVPDGSHSPKLESRKPGARPGAATAAKDGFPSAEVFEHLVEATYRPREFAILTGDPEAPFLCIDPPFMRRPLPEKRAEQALETLIDTIDRSLRDVVLEPGQVLIIDNKRAVHGRRPFKARYDGTDRWLRRIKVTADLRATDGRRFGPAGRAVV